MALGDLFLITSFATIQGQQVVNTFTYVQRGIDPGTGSNAQALADAFDLKFLSTAGAGLRNAVISDDVVYTSMRVQNLFNDTDYYELVQAPGTTGGDTGAAAPPFVAYSLRTQWLGGSVRRGFKRIAGVGNARVVNGVLEPIVITTLTTLAEEMSDILTATGGREFVPCVVKRIREGVAPNYTYRLPENAGESVFIENVTWQVQPNATSQNSRKLGRGV